MHGRVGMSGLVTTSEEFLDCLMRHQRRIYGFVYTLVPNRADAEDILHDTVLVLWRKWAEYDPRRDFLRWACGIARNEIRNYFRKQQGRPEHLSEAALDQLAAVIVESQDWLAARRKALDECVKKLPPRQHDLVRKCYGADQSIKEVAHQLHWTANALYKTLRRIRRALHECVDRALES